MKKFILFGLFAIFLLSLSACNKDSKSAAQSNLTDISCENVDTSSVDKKMLKEVLATIDNMKQIVLRDWEPGNYFDFSLNETFPYQDFFHYGNPYATPEEMSIRVWHRDGEENLIIRGPSPELISQQCVLPREAEAQPAFCCAVHELDPKYEVKQRPIHP